MSNVNYKQIVEDTRALTRFFRAFEAMQSALDNIVSIEQATKDAERAKAVAVDERERAVQAAQQAGAQLTAALAEVTEAKAKAKQIVADATDKADNIVVAAESKAAEIVAQAEAREATAAAQVAEYGKKAAAAEELVEAKRKEFDELSSKIDKLKAQAAKVLG